MARRELEDVEVHLHAETEKAWLVSDTGDSEDAVWVPKSQAELVDGVLTAPVWLLTEKGLV